MEDNSPGARVLIVEDSPIVSFHLQSSLESEGYQVVGLCDSGEEAIAFVEQKKPDLALMDIMLVGNLDGIETAALLRTRFDVPVIYITALNDRETINRAKTTEPYAYVTKPFKDREVFTAIEMTLYKHRIESRLRESEEKYFRTVNSISDAVVSFGTDQRIVYMNPSACSLTRWRGEEAIGRQGNEVLNIIVNGSDVEQDLNAIVWTDPLHENLTLKSRDGKLIPIGGGSISPLIDASGKQMGFVLVFKDLTEQRKAERMIQALEIQRKSAVIEGQDTERARIARDLHDGLGQLLNAIKIKTDVIMKGSREASALSDLLQEAIHESVRISENLLPSKLRDFDLSACLKSLCAQMRDSTAADIRFIDQEGLGVLDQFQKINLYRIAQEALNNAIKHSDARNITVEVSDGNGMLTMTIRDDGRGVDMAALQRVNGMNNMKDRAEIIGGKFVIEGDPHRGTVVTVEASIHR